MPKKATWEDADLLLRIDDVAARPDTRSALDWYRSQDRELGPTEPVVIRRESPDFVHVQRFVDLFELMGTLVRSGVLDEDLVLDRWDVRGPWRFLAATIERERRNQGARFARNFEWLATRSEKRSDERDRPARR
jgi:hypothetical protein